jgi:hypothetical protein
MQSTEERKSAWKDVRFMIWGMSYLISNISDRTSDITSCLRPVRTDVARIILRKLIHTVTATVCNLRSEVIPYG